MKQTKNIIKLLVFSIALVGCSVEKAVLSDADSVLVSNVNSFASIAGLQEIYEKAYTTAGKTVVINEILNQIALLEMTANASNRTHGYSETYINSRIDEKLVTLSKSASYKLDGVFSEQRFALTLENQGYTITCTNGYSDVTGELKCDYTDYKNRNLRPTVNREILFEEYIFADPDNKNFFSENEIREVEYFFMDKLTDERFNFVNQILADGAVSFSTFQTAWRDYLKGEIDKDFAKIGTDDDTNQAYETKFSGSNTYPLAHGLMVEKRKIDNNSYTETKVITSTDATFSTNVEAKLFDSKVASTLIMVDGVGYLPSLNDPEQLIVTDNSKYYFIRVRVIDEASESADKEKGAKTLASISSNVGGAVLYYLNKYGLKIYEEELYTYLADTYNFEITK